LLLLIPFGIDTPKKIRYAALSPTYYPQIVAVILAIIGTAIMFKNRKIVQEEQFPKLDNSHPNASLRITGFLLLLAIYALGLSFLGFIISGTLALSLSLLLAGERSPTTIVLISFLLPVLLYLFFYKVAHVPVPNGILAPLLQWV